MSVIGKRIKEMRLKKGLTQEELGELLGVKKAAVQKYENGMITNLKIDTIKKLCEIFVEPPYKFIWEEIDEFDHTIVKMIQMRPQILRKLLDSEYGSSMGAALELFEQLNRVGQSKIIEHADDLLKIAEYRKEL